MATNGYGPTPVPGHIGRIPNYGKTHVNPMGSVEPPACIQNAMMTKDKKPFTYTPGGLDLSQIKTPSMARRMARQRSLEEQEQAYGGHHGTPNHQSQGGGPIPPPPPPPSIPAPPPPPPLIIAAPNNTTSKPVALGERPEIVIPENPIGMLRKTNSPYHWEAEQADMQRIGPVPKFVEKVPSPLTVKLPQNPPQNYSKQFSNTIQSNQSPGSPLYRPEALYAPNSGSPGANGTPPMREMLVRQDSQFNKSPQPFANQSPLSNNSTYSPTPNNHWKQPDKRDSEVSGNSPQSPQWNRGPFSPNVTQNSPSYQNSPPNPSVYHTLPRAGQRNQDNVMHNNNNDMMNNNNIMSNRNNNYENVNESQQSPNINPSNTAPWRTNTINRNPRDNQMSNNNNQPPTQQAYSPPWKRDNSYNPVDNNNAGGPEIKHSPNEPANQQEYIPPWVAQDNNNNKVPNSNVPWRPHEAARNTPPTSPPENRYQSSISIPVTPKNQPPQPKFNNSTSQREAVYVNQEPVYYCPDSPKSIPPWVKTQKEKTKTPPPAWCQKPLDGRRSAPRELVTPPRETNAEPEWVRKSNEMQRGAREIISPPKYQQPVQPNWSTLPSENRKSVPKDSTQGSRIIPIQMEVSSTETRNQGRQSNNQPQLRIVIDMQQNPNSENQSRTQAPYSQPTQRIMRVLSPQLVRMDEGQDHSDLPSLNRSFQMNQDSQPKTRIIPIQIESNGNGGANKSVYYHKFCQDGPPQQSKSFKVLQVITNTHDGIQYMERHGYSDL